MTHTVFRALTTRHLDDLLVRAGLDEADRVRAAAVAAVFPFRTNAYVVDSLIDWAAAPDDPLFRLNFPQPGMLAPADLARMEGLIRSEAPAREMRAAANEIRRRHNPHPSGQLDRNQPTLDGVPLEGLQHKYAETVLVFPSQGQTCHAYCTYCFRWPQFVGEPELKIATGDQAAMSAYLRAHPEVTSVLITGGDALIMRTDVLRRYVEPLLEIDHIESIRLGTKALAYWPFRFTTDPDADALLALFDQVIASGRHLAVMAHYSHPVELDPEPAREALRRVRSTGAVIRAQGPLIRGVNDEPAVWSRLWRESTRLGVVPYYMFVERDTGPQDHFGVPLARAVDIFQEAFASVSGLARTVRGPVMSADPGKAVVDGTAEIAGEKVFVLRMLQARDPSLVGRPFFARYDPDATWLSDLRPAYGTDLLPT
ncbi:lysine 2,3-aminomutase [Actinocorallia longicatena]|uniref:KamA family radical SAM protein n=1 Tax=Actinocorallia longicatena TaxID=111803 RepID=A0ABP6QSN0_9ACTN